MANVVMMELERQFCQCASPQNLQSERQLCNAEVVNWLDRASEAVDYRMC